MSLGALIIKARKNAALSIEDVAAITNIRVAIIREIERDDFTNCGGATYARGHLRNIARAINANEEEVLQIFDEKHSDQHRALVDLLKENYAIQKLSDRGKISLKLIIIISLSSLIIAAAVQIVLSNRSVLNSVAPTITTSPSPSSSLTQTPTPMPSQQSSFSTGTGVEVVVGASRATSWLLVSDASGRTLFSGQIPKGSSRIFTTDMRLDLKIGNAGGVDLKVNGKKIDAIGVDGQVVGVSYDKDS